MALASVPQRDGLATQYTVNRSSQHVVAIAIVVAATALFLLFYAPVECCFETDAKATINAKSIKRLD